MNHSSVAHRWANDNYTRNGELNGPRMFAEQHSRTIYSHGRHFPIARLTGVPAFPVLFTYRGYSVSTSKHISEVRNALAHSVWQARFECHTPSDSPSRILQVEWEAMNGKLHELQRATDAAAAMEARIAARAAKGQPASDTLAGQLETLQNRAAGQQTAIRDRAKQLDEFARAFSVNVKTDCGVGTYATARAFLKSADLMKLSADTQKRSDKLAREQAKARAKAEAEAIARRAKNKIAWLAGDPVDFRTYGDEPTLLRVMDDEVETSAGAVVPVRHALRLYALASRCVESETPWDSPPEKAFPVGHYTLNSITTNGDVAIGCHRLTFEEMARVAPAARLAAENTAAVTA